MSQEVSSGDIMAYPSNLINEIRIPVPWGVIAAKAWGDPCGLPVLAVHGMADNAGTFDNLIPLLSPIYHIVCIDLPGHGYSSHFQEGILLDFLDYVTSIKRAIDYLQWEKFLYMGHSLGAQLGIYFSAIYPHHVIKLLMIDGLTDFNTTVEKLFPQLIKNSENLFNMEEKLKNRKPPLYTLSEAIEIMKAKRVSKLTNHAVKRLSERGLVTENGGVRFAVDQRLKVRIRPLILLEQHSLILKELQCPVLFIRAEHSEIPFDHKTFSPTFHILKQNPCVTIEIVEGNHDVHNNDPYKVAQLTNKFFCQIKSLL